MNVQHLIYVVEIHKCGSISKAAQNLFMAQPNLSNAIKELEHEIGITVFKRTPKGIETTKDGLEFIQYASEIITRMNALEKYYSRQSGNPIRISITTMRSSIICGKFVKYINDFQSLHGDRTSFRIHFKEATNFDSINDVVNDQADIGIIRANVSSYNYFCQLAESKRCTVIPLPADHYSVLMSKHHPLAGHPLLTANLLKPYTEIIHGDFETPWYPYSDIYHSDLSGLSTEKLIFVYDRASLLDFIRSVQGAYAWTTSTHPDILKAYELTELPCEKNDMEGREAIILKKDVSLAPETRQLIDQFTKQTL